MPARIGEADLGGRETDDSADYAYGGVRSEADDDLPYHVLRLVDLVESGHAVDVFEFVVNELRHSHEVSRYVTGYDDVLRHQLQQLGCVCEWFPLEIRDIAERFEPWQV